MIPNRHQSGLMQCNFPCFTVLVLMSCTLVMSHTAICRFLLYSCHLLLATLSCSRRAVNYSFIQSRDILFLVQLSSSSDIYQLLEESCQFLQYVEMSSLIFCIVVIPYVQLSAALEELSISFVCRDVISHFLYSCHPILATISCSVSPVFRDVISHFLFTGNFQLLQESCQFLLEVEMSSLISCIVVIPNQQILAAPGELSISSVCKDVISISCIVSLPYRHVISCSRRVVNFSRMQRWDL